MGNKPPKPEPPPPPPPKDPTENEEEEEEQDTEYQWPANLYLELRDFVEVSSLVYSFAYLLNAARMQALDGVLDTDLLLPDLQALADAVNDDAVILPRTFTPAAIASILTKHQAFLTNNPHFPDDPQAMLESIQQLQQRIPAGSPEDVLTLRDYDDVYQTSELVYAIGIDRLNKRVSLILRGTDNQLAFQNNWLSNIDIWKEKVSIPPHAQHLTDLDRVWIHGGFYNLVMQETKTQKDAPETTKYSQVLAALQQTLQEVGPGYKVYVTGHSLGGAVSTVFGFLLACEPDVPKPVTVLNFASPRVGDSNFLKVCDALQQHHWLRVCRMVNDNDLVTVVPSWNFYHVGFQVKVYRKVEEENAQQRPLELTFPKVDDAWFRRLGRAWDNGLLTSVDLTFDHSILDYRARVLVYQEALSGLDLNDLYRDASYTGYPPPPPPPPEAT